MCLTIISIELGEMYSSICLHIYFHFVKVKVEITIFDQIHVKIHNIQWQFKVLISICT